MNKCCSTTHSSSFIVSISSAEGFTLVELMIAVLIVSTLAVMAIPTLGRGRHDAAFHSDTRRLIHQMHEVARKSLTTREDQCIEIDPKNSTVVYKMRLPADPTVVSELGRWSMNEGTRIVKMIASAKMPSTVNTFPKETVEISVVTEMCFTANHEVLLSTNGSSVWSNRSLTLYFSDEKGYNQSRLIVFGSTGFVKLYDH